MGHCTNKKSKQNKRVKTQRKRKQKRNSSNKQKKNNENEVKEVVIFLGILRVCLALQKKKKINKNQEPVNNNVLANPEPVNKLPVNPTCKSTTCELATSGTSHSSRGCW